ncbi:site-specific DNA-methyltransferase [Helicobacter bilis]|uniref:site-specific DNA-methyltransferase n=1 Tax=Helicobacter bilis TaxID=37372 RepID=UPI0009B87483|nr:site-specific DNA-methyltransferase [Helicobacter bilis]TLE08937.1 site-specific DNA-methyltransferase [Helicobacter bilis]
MIEVFQKLPDSKSILQDTYKYRLSGNFNADNLLIYDDNLNAMRFLVQELDYKNSIDLVYIDPPFGTNNIFKLGSTMSAEKDSKIAYKDKFSLESYLEFLYCRLVWIRELMSEKGSLYLHIDSKMGYYVKILCDEVFGRENFINDITRIKCNPKNFKRKAYGNIKDMILFYAKSSQYIWNEIKDEVLESDLKKRFNKQDSKGYYTTIPLHAPGITQNGESGQEWNGIKPPNGRHWRYSLKELDKLQEAGLIEWSKNNNPRKKVYINECKGKKIQDIWEFKDSQNPAYPTEKNRAMLRRIITMSSNMDSRVMDCFCGGGGFLQESLNLGRKFIGIDESIESIKLNQQWIKESENHLFSRDIALIKKCVSNRIINEVKENNHMERISTLKLQKMINLG